MAEKARSNALRKRFMIVSPSGCNEMDISGLVISGAERRQGLEQRVEETLSLAPGLFPGLRGELPHFLGFPAEFGLPAGFVIEPGLGFPVAHVHRGGGHGVPLSACGCVVSCEQLKG
jgi:hypothetical protein